MNRYQNIAAKLSILPQLAATLLLATIVAGLITMLYIGAYLFLPAGLLFAAFSVVSLSPIGVVLGLFFAGFGGFVYVEWFTGSSGTLPTISELAARVARVF